ncbi:MAG: SWIM zinc finger family protein [Pseudomonadota bacterium]
MITDYEIHQRRAEKGKRLSSQVTQHRNGFYVRFKTGSAKVYNVKLENGQWKCDCDDFRYRSEKLRLRFDFSCKHILAVQYALKYGSVHGTRSIKETRERVAMQQRGVSRRRTYTTGVVP